jgi:hypothetical protein
MKIARWSVAVGVSLATMSAAQALPVTQPQTEGQILRAQLNCTGPRCLSTGPIRQPYLRGTRPLDMPGREWLRQVPQRPAIKLQQPEMDYRVPRLERKEPVVRQVRPPDPSYQVIKVPPEHQNWCLERYKSYRTSDNTYQPFSGPRKQCQSPYG